MPFTDRRADICAIPPCKNSLGSTRERAKQQQQTIKGKSPTETVFSSVFGIFLKCICCRYKCNCVDVLGKVEISGAT